MGSPPLETFCFALALGSAAITMRASITETLLAWVETAREEIWSGYPPAVRILSPQDPRVRAGLWELVFEVEGRDLAIEVSIDGKVRLMQDIGAGVHGFSFGELALGRHDVEVVVSDAAFRGDDDRVSIWVEPNP